MLATNSEVYKCIYGNNLMFAKSSVHGRSTMRMDRAKEQAVLAPTAIDDIIDYTNDFLNKLCMIPVLNPKTDLSKLADMNEYYEDIERIYKLRDKRDIVWMAFTTDGYLGVVAVSNDIGFDMPPKQKSYHDKINGDWKYSTSGIIVHSLGKTWNKSFVLVFPLQNIPNGLTRGDIECGIGNYLIWNGVPILDYYSHRF